jgi:hypothetical protein
VTADSPAYREAAQKVRVLENRRSDLVDAINLVHSARRKLDPHDLPTAKLIAESLLLTLRSAHEHTTDALDRRQAEAARLWSDGQDSPEAAR